MTLVERHNAPPPIWPRFAELTGATRPLAPAAVGAALLAAVHAAVAERFMLLSRSPASLSG